MGGKSRTSVTKRQKEQARQQRRQSKVMKREQRAAEKTERAPGAIEGEDPDIAGIVPGPQPHPFLDPLEQQEPGEDENQP